MVRQRFAGGGEARGEKNTLRWPPRLPLAPLPSVFMLGLLSTSREGVRWQAGPAWPEQTGRQAPTTEGQHPRGTSTSIESCCGPGLTGVKCSEGHLAAGAPVQKKQKTPVKNSRPQSKSVDPGQNQSTQGVPRSKSAQPNTFEIPSPFPSRWKLRWKIVRP